MIEEVAENYKCMQCRGRAAFQRRVGSIESVRASGPVVALLIRQEFFRNLLGFIA